MGEEQNFNQVIRIPLSNNRVILCRIDLGGTIVVGPGPRPKKEGAILAHRIDDDSVLTIEIAIVSAEAASISVGPGPR